MRKRIATKVADVDKLVVVVANQVAQEAATAVVQVVVMDVLVAVIALLVSTCNLHG